MVHCKTEKCRDFMNSWDFVNGNLHFSKHSPTAFYNAYHSKSHAALPTELGEH